MIYISNSLRKNRFFLICFIIISAFNSQAQLVISNQGAPAATILSGFIGTGLTITNPVITCGANAYGTFSGGSGIGVTNGVTLTTGNASRLNKPESYFMDTNYLTTCSDAQLTSLEPLATNDCCILEFDVVPSCNTLSVRFIFGSEEYPDYAPPNAGVNDVFGFFVTGPNPTGGNYTNKNIAILTGTTICSIDNVNPINNPSYFVDNTGGTTLPFGGYTTAITSTLSVTPCQSYHFKIAIADAMDHAYDSGVLIDFLQCTTTLTATTTVTATTCGQDNGTATCVASNGIGTLSYTWSPTPGGGQGTPNATGLVGGTAYTCLVDDIYACIASITTPAVTPATSALPPNVTNTPLAETVCSGSSTTNVTLTADIVGTTFTWTASATAGVTGYTTSGTSTIPSQTIINSGTTNGTVTYVVTPRANGCDGPPVNYVITVNPQITPTFTPIGTLCQNDPEPTLQPSSNNTPAITGNWSPSTVSTSTFGTITYTFTPTSGGCVTTATLDVTISNPVTPTFTAIPDVCQNAASPVLPTTSNNSIPGSWSPSTVSTATTGTSTYTFTPQTGQCAVSTTLNVTTTTPVTTTLTAIPNMCQNATAPTLPSTSNNGFTGSWNPSAINTATTGTSTYTFTPSPSQCATTATLDVFIDTPINPTFNSVPNVCQNSSPIPLPTSSTNSPAITGNWAPPVSTTNTGTTVYTFTPTSGQCANSTTLNGTVDPEITPTFDPIADLCLNDPAPTLPTTSTNGVSGSWSPNTSTSTVGTTTYTFTPSPGVCSPTVTLDITVLGLITPLFTPINPICVGSTVPVLQTSSNNIPAITGSWSPNVSIATAATTTYTFTPAANQCASNTTLDIVVNPLPVLIVTNPDTVCAPAKVDLTSASVTAGSSGGTISYCDSPSGLNPLPNPSSISVPGTYFIISETNLGCKVPLPVVVEISSNPTANFTPSPSILNSYNLSSTMNNTSIGAVSYEWYFMDGATSNLDNPTHEFPDSTYGDQNILLIATSAGGCKDTIIKSITIEEELIIYIPNSFTPDPDIHNPTFQPVFTSGYDPYVYSMLIFNRWGEIVFETHDVSVGWNGTFGNTNKVQDDVYTWRIEFKLSKKDEHRILVGSVNLIR